MTGVLFLCHRIPYPPNKGDKIRSYHILKKLAEQYSVFVGTFIDDPLDWNYVAKIQALATDSCILERTSLQKMILPAISTLFSTKPLTNKLYFSLQMRLWVENLIQSKSISKIVVFSVSMAQYVLKFHTTIPIVTDFVDVDSEKWSAYSQYRRFPLNIFCKLEAKRLAAYETLVAQHSSTNIFVSPQEVNLFKKLSPSVTKPIMCVSNGVDSQFFNPNLKYPNPYHGAKKRILFTGLMNYWPNVDAVSWFVKYVFTILAQQDKHIEFYIVGANPTKAVFQLMRENIIVTGRVPDVRPYLKHADVVVAPLRVAQGLQNKVLEAMSMNKSIVASAQALEGIRVPKKGSIWVEITSKNWINRIENILYQIQDQPIDMHPWIVNHYSWENNLTSLSHILEGLNVQSDSHA
ncbi:MAG TPA: TIGR03087 family PEP-CTERM/XrtA system glycosyltransferase [Gammaproteobacteria bacterium]|nr:TIGR03087 family PEP-CTERM/XrtA system glycosyltransferase [Gammaproteobacteria bacterium]